MDDIKEEVEHVGRSESGSNEGTRGNKGNGNEGNGDPSGDRGREEGGSTGSEGGSAGTQGGSAGSGQGSGGSKGNDRKADLLQSIRNKRANGQHKPSSSANGASLEHPEGNSEGNRGSQHGTKANTGTTPGNDRNIGRDSKQDDHSYSGPSEIAQTNDRNSRINDKPQGVKVKGVDKIKELAQKASKTQAPKLKFTWDDKALTNKEADEVLPKVKALLEFVFRHMDKGISISNRNKVQAHIWSAIDDEDITIIAEHLVEMGKASKIVATAVRRMTNSYRLLQIGLITLPKFIQTFQFYQENGGFALMGGK